MVDFHFPSVKQTWAHPVSKENDVNTNLLCKLFCGWVLRGSVICLNELCLSYVNPLQDMKRRKATRNLFASFLFFFLHNLYINSERGAGNGRNKQTTKKR